MPEAPKIVRRERLFSGRKVALEVHHVRTSDGRETTREVICHGGSVAILAFPEPGRVLLVKNWRYPVGREMLELPAGTLQEGEEPRACAERELAEETGYRAGRLERLLVIHPSPGVLSERLEIFLAGDLTPGLPRREAGEEIENVLLEVDKAIRMICEGRLSDGKTVAGLLFWDRFGRGRE